jgi:hypothetical protein
MLLFKRPGMPAHQESRVIHLLLCMYFLVMLKADFVLEFGKEHDLPHLHVLLGRFFFDEADPAALYTKRN